MRLATWNLLAGGGGRVARLMSGIAAQAPDVVVLTEFRHGPRGNEVRAGLADLGLVNIRAPEVGPRVNTVLIGSRHPLLELPGIEVPSAIARHVIAVGTANLALFGVYFPLNRAKISVFDWLFALPASITGGPALITGDFNTGRNDVDREPGGARFVAARAMDRFADRGWTDAWRHRHGDAREYSWRSSRNGFRIDHAFVSASLLPGLIDARYDHGVREAGHSDHSMLVTEVGNPSLGNERAAGELRATPLINARPT